MIRTESIVKLKKTYTGYFEAYKGKKLTVMQVINENRLTILEIPELHLIDINHFTEVKNVTK
jgi:hypothetical protein